MENNYWQFCCQTLESYKDICTICYSNCFCIRSRATMKVQRKIIIIDNNWKMSITFISQRRKKMAKQNKWSSFLGASFPKSDRALSNANKKCRLFSLIKQEISNLILVSNPKVLQIYQKQMHKKMKVWWVGETNREWDSLMINWMSKIH